MALFALILVVALSTSCTEPQALDWVANYDKATSFTISTPAEFVEFSALVNSGKDFKGKTVTLGADIDLDGIDWIPIGECGTWGDFHPFRGTFDGKGHTISNLKVTATNKIKVLYKDDPDADDGGIRGEGCALFGVISEAEVKDFKLEDVAISGLDRTAGVVAFALGENTIKNVDVLSGTITSNPENTNGQGNSCGAIVAQIWNFSHLLGADDAPVIISNCSNAATVDGYNNTGSILGSITNGHYPDPPDYEGGRPCTTILTITDCTNSGKISNRNATIGQAIGWANFSGTGSLVNFTSKDNTIYSDKDGRPVTALIFHNNVVTITSAS